MTKFCGNRPANFLKIEVLVGSPHANFDQNRINVEKFDKKQDLKANRTKKKQETCKMTRSTNGSLEISKFLVFIPRNLEKPVIF